MSKLNELVEELRAWWMIKPKSFIEGQKKTNKFLSILDHYTPASSIAEEPLACLAKRNGFWKITTIDGVDSMANGFVSIEIEREVFDIRKTPKRCEMFVAKDYAAVEAKARQYLMGLPDREAK